MPILPRLSPRRLCVAGLLLLVTALIAFLVLPAAGPMDASRERYDRIQVGMTKEEVGAMLSDWRPGSKMPNPYFQETWWYDPRSGMSIWVYLDSDNKVWAKDIQEGDQSFEEQVDRLKDRLADKLHLGP
jgi:hypothetical protein